jgi:phage terminase large subunit
VDEVNQVSKKAWNITKSRIRYKVDEYGLVPKMLGTCNPAKNWVYSDFYKPSLDGTIEPSKRFIQALLSDNPFISKHYRENLLTLDRNSMERLLNGNWEYDDDPAALMAFNKIQDLFTNSFAERGEKYISADIARFGNDNTVIGVWDGFVLEHLITIEKNKVTEAAERIKQLCKTHSVPLSNVICDDDGVGGGVVDILGCEGFVNSSTPLVNKETKEPENYNHLKSQCYFKLAELVNANKMWIRDDKYRDIIIQELEQVKQYNMDKDGKKQIVPKDKVKELLGRSPDYSDMLMMRCWFELRMVHNFFTF